MRRKRGVFGPVLNKTLLFLLIFIILSYSVALITYRIVTAGQRPPEFDQDALKSFELMYKEISDLRSGDENILVPMFGEKSEIIPYYKVSPDGSDPKPNDPKNEDECLRRACICLYSVTSNIPLCKGLDKKVELMEGISFINFEKNKYVYLSRDGNEICISEDQDKCV